MGRFILMISIIFTFLNQASCNVTSLDTNEVLQPLSAEGSNATHESGGHGHSITLASWHFEYVKTPLLICLFLIIIAVSKLAFHRATFLSNVVPESCLLIVLGTIVGFIIHEESWIDAKFQKLNSDIFFLILLPPIILESAYSLHDRVFFDNLGSILLFAVVGTILNMAILSLALWGLAVSGAMGTIDITLVDCLLFGSLIVAVDPVAVLAIFQDLGVNNILYFLVFGESLLNDAVTVVLYNSMIKIHEMEVIPVSQIFMACAAFFTVSCGGLLIGIIFGMITAFMTKYTTHVRVVEPLAMFTFAYTSYLTAELFHLSGIISIIGCGLTQAQYAFHNISSKSQTTVTYFSKVMSATCDCIIFMFLGLSIANHDSRKYHIGFTCWTILLCLVVRFLVVYVLTFLLNRLNRITPIGMEEQFIMSYGGLRGAVAYSLATLLSSTVKHQALFETTTLAVILCTVFIQGISIKPLVKWLRIRKSQGKVVSVYETVMSHVADHVMAGIETIVGQKGSNSLREVLSAYDNKYLRRWLQKNPYTKDDQIMVLYQKVALQIHCQNVYGGGPNDDDSLFAYEPSYAVDEVHPLQDPTSIYRGMDAARRWKSFALAKKKISTISDEDEDDVSLEDAPAIPSSDFLDVAESHPQPHLVDSDHLNADNLVKMLEDSNTDFHRKYDKNIQHDHKNDLIHQLNEKRRRMTRWRHSTQGFGLMSPPHRHSRSDAISPFNPIEEIEDGNQSNNTGRPRSRKKRKVMGGLTKSWEQNENRKERIHSSPPAEEANAATDVGSPSANPLIHSSEI